MRTHTSVVILFSVCYSILHYNGGFTQINTDGPHRISSEGQILKTPYRINQLRDFSQTSFEQMTFDNVILADFQVNSDPRSRYPSLPDIGVDANGDFIIVWSDDCNGDKDIYCQAYASSGSAIGGNFRVNDDVGSSEQITPVIAVDASGHFVISWIDKRSGTYHLYYQRYSSGGAALGANLRVNESGWTQDPSIAINSSGNFIIAWTDWRNGNADIYFQRYNSSGTPIGGNTKVNTDAGSSWQGNSTVGMDGSGNFVVAWADDRNGGGDYDVYCQRYDSGGSALLDNFRVNDDVGSRISHWPAIGFDDYGNFVITWTDTRNLQYRWDIYCQRYDGNGTALGSNFVVNDDGTGFDQMYPSIAFADNAYFVVAWEDKRSGESDSEKDIYGQVYNNTGTAVGNNFRINTDTGKNTQTLPEIGIHGQTLISTWQDDRVSTMPWSIFANMIDLTDLITDTVATPTVDPPPGMYTDPLYVTISCSTPGATIHYTMDGSEPSDSDPVYTSPIHVSSTTTLKARAYKSGLTPSDVCTGTYTIYQEPVPPDSEGGATFIQLQQGWNLFSFDVMPSDLSVSGLLSSIARDFNLVIGYENGAEIIYDAASPLTSTLQELNPLQGYYIQMLSPATLSITGTEISDTESITLTEGVHLISYLPDDPLPVEEALESIMDHVVFVKAIDHKGVSHGQGANGGLSYDPELPEFSTLLTMQNGFGYWIKVDSIVTLSYPEETIGAVLASTVIGPGGGTLSTDEFILSVPQGAFTADVTLTLYETSDDSSFYDNTVSTIFAIEGLPEEYSQPLTICIKYTSELSDESYIAIGEKVFIPDLLTSEYLHNLYSAVDSSGFLTGILPASTDGTQQFKNINLKEPSLLDANLIYAMACTRFESHKTDFFKIRYPRNIQKDAILGVGEYFDDAASQLENVNFHFDPMTIIFLMAEGFTIIIEGEKSPISYAIKTEKYNPPIEYPRDAPKCTMHINEKELIGDEDILRQMVGILVFDLFQWIKFNDMHEWKWLNFAFEMWMGEKFSLEPSQYDPWRLRDPGKLRPFNGMEAGCCIPEGFDTPQRAVFLLNYLHGSGMAPFIKYLENQYQMATVQQIFQNVSNQEPVDAIMNILQDPEYEWWPKFFKNYVGGSLYHVDAQTFLNRIKKEDRFIIEGDTDTLHYFDRPYLDFSANLFRVDLKYDKIDSIAFNLGPPSLNLDYVTFFIYGLRDGQLEYFDQGAQYEGGIGLTVPSIQDKIQAGYTSLIAVVVNSANEPPYTGTINIELDVRAKQKKHQCTIELGNIQYDATVSFPWGGTDTHSDDLNYDLYHIVKGKLKGSIYEAWWQDKRDTWSLNNSDGYIRVEFDFNQKIIKYLEIDLVSEGSRATYELSIEAKDIPFCGIDNDGYEVYQHLGESIKPYITHLTFIERFHGDLGDIVTTLTDFSMQSNSYLRISFK